MLVGYFRAASETHIRLAALFAVIATALLFMGDYKLPLPPSVTLQIADLAPGILPYLQAWPNADNWSRPDVWQLAVTIPLALGGFSLLISLLKGLFRRSRKTETAQSVEPQMSDAGVPIYVPPPREDWDIDIPKPGKALKAKQAAEAAEVAAAQPPKGPGLLSRAITALARFLKRASVASGRGLWRGTKYVGAMLLLGLKAGMARLMARLKSSESVEEPALSDATPESDLAVVAVEDNSDELAGDHDEALRGAAKPVVSGVQTEAPATETTFVDEAHLVLVEDEDEDLGHLALADDPEPSVALSVEPSGDVAVDIEVPSEPDAEDMNVVEREVPEPSMAISDQDPVPDTPAPAEKLEVTEPLEVPRQSKGASAFPEIEPIGIIEDDIEIEKPERVSLAARVAPILTGAASRLPSLSRKASKPNNPVKAEAAKDAPETSKLAMIAGRLKPDFSAVGSKLAIKLPKRAEKASRDDKIIAQARAKVDDPAPVEVVASAPKEETAKPRLPLPNFDALKELPPMVAQRALKMVEKYREGRVPVLPDRDPFDRIEKEVKKPLQQ